MEFKLSGRKKGSDKGDKKNQKWEPAQMLKGLIELGEYHGIKDQHEQQN